MEEIRQSGLNSMLRYLAEEDLEGRPPFQILALRQSPGSKIDGVDAVRLEVRGVSADGEEFFEITQAAVKDGAAFIIDGFARKQDQAEAQKEFDSVIAGFKFR